MLYGKDHKMTIHAMHRPRTFKAHMARACKGTVKAAAGEGGGGVVLQKSAVFISECLGWLWQMEFKIIFFFVNAFMGQWDFVPSG